MGEGGPNEMKSTKSEIDRERRKILSDLKEFWRPVRIQNPGSVPPD